MKDFKCRGCGKECNASFLEVLSNVVKCLACGGICDPTEKTLRRRLKAKKVIGGKGAFTDRACML